MTRNKELKILKKKIISIIKLVYDPEILINIWELGLIYRIDLLKYQNMNIKMTLTSLFCPFAEKILEEIKSTICLSIVEIENVNIDLLWGVKWKKNMLKKKTRFVLELV